MKTNVNGYELWHKLIGSMTYTSGLWDVKQTSDGGYIMCGSSRKNTSNGDTFFAKTDPCLNIEWCRQYASSCNNIDLGQEVFELDNGYVMMVAQFGCDIENERIWLFRLDSSGTLLWENYFGQTDTLITNEISQGLTTHADGRYYISGSCWYPEAGSTTLYHEHPFIIKVDSTGIAEWELPWKDIPGSSILFRGEAFQSILDNKGTIYSCGRHYATAALPPYGDRPVLLKTDSAGNELAYKDLKDSTTLGLATTIDWFADSTIAVGAGWVTLGGMSTNAVVKIDWNGNVLNTKDIFDNDYTFQDAVVTADNKLILVAGPYINNMYNTYAWKLNSNLEYDSIYTQPLVYDSLCPYPITSDTIPLDCEIVGLDEPLQNPETGRLKVFPNPAFNQLHIEIPDKLKSGKQSPMFTITTIYHQWRSASLEIYNLFGERLYSGPIRQDDRTLDLDVSSWPRGMYVVRLVYNKNTVASEKVVLE